MSHTVEHLKSIPDSELEQVIGNSRQMLDADIAQLEQSMAPVLERVDALVEEGEGTEAEESAQHAIEEALDTAANNLLLDLATDEGSEEEDPL